MELQTGAWNCPYTVDYSRIWCDIYDMIGTLTWSYSIVSLFLLRKYIRTWGYITRDVIESTHWNTSLPQIIVVPLSHDNAFPLMPYFVFWQGGSILNEATKRCLEVAPGEDTYYHLIIQNCTGQTWKIQHIIKQFWHRDSWEGGRGVRIYHETTE